MKKIQADPSSTSFRLSFALWARWLRHGTSVKYGQFFKESKRTLVYSGKVIAIEPADEETAAFLVQLADLAEKVVDLA